MAAWMCSHDSVGPGTRCPQYTVGVTSQAELDAVLCRGKGEPVLVDAQAQGPTGQDYGNR